MASSNIETVARVICANGLARHAKSAEELARDVERFWHCIAAELEGGLIDEAGNHIVPRDLDQDLKAYRDWRRRHPTYVPPPPRILKT
jgi:hypothetical protein